MQGVEVRKRSADEVRVRRICVRYEDGGTVSFVPEAKEEFFTKDDSHRVVGMLRAGSEVLEWGLEFTRKDPESSPDNAGGSV